MASCRMVCTPGPKCMRPGPVTRNAFFNFLREYRKTNCGLGVVETVVNGAKVWRSMSQKEKSTYITMAKSAPKMKRRSRRLQRGRRMSRGRIGRARSQRRRSQRTRSAGRRRRLIRRR